MNSLQQLHKNFTEMQAALSVANDLAVKITKELAKNAAPKKTSSVVDKVIANRIVKNKLRTLK